MKELILDMRDTIWGLKGENHEMKNELLESSGMVDEVRAGMEDIKKLHNIDLTVLRWLLQEKDDAFASIKSKQESWKLVKAAVVCFILLFVVWIVTS